MSFLFHFFRSLRIKEEIMKTIVHGYGNELENWMPHLENEGRKISAGAQNTFRAMVRCAAGKDHTFVNVATLAKRLNVSIRTIQRHIALLEKIKIIRLKEEWINGWKEKVYYFLFHPIIEKYQKSKARKTSQPKRMQPLQADRTDQSRNDETKTSENSAWSEHQEPAINGQNGDNLSHVLNKEKDIEPPPSPSMNISGDAEEGEDFSTNENCENWWVAVREKIGQSEKCPFPPAILNSFSARREHDRLIIEVVAPLLDRARLIQQELLQELAAEGIREVCFQPKSGEKLTEEYLEMRRRNEQQIIKQQQRRFYEKRVQQEIINTLPQKNKFGLLLEKYPRKTGKVEQAEKVFNNLSGQNFLPDFSLLLEKLAKEKSSLNWQKDEGRWIPGLSKWLQQIATKNKGQSYGK